MPNRIAARSAKAALTNATGRLPLLRLFSTPLVSMTKTHQPRPRDGQGHQQQTEYGHVF